MHEVSLQVLPKDTFGLSSTLSLRVMVQNSIVGTICLAAISACEKLGVMEWARLANLPCAQTEALQLSFELCAGAGV